jgi:hypothetical protein
MAYLWHCRHVNNVKHSPIIWIDLTPNCTHYFLIFILTITISTIKTPLLDELGHHISTACGQGGHRIMTYDSVKFCIKDLLNSCGIKTRVEVAECFCWYRTLCVCVFSCTCV